MNLLEVTKRFKTDEDCLYYIENSRWPNGEICCVHCGEIGRISIITREKAGENKRSRIFQCLACNKQFSATSGTIFSDTHLPLKKWFMAIALITEAKKGISAKQVARHLGMESSYKTVWYLCHRIREAMKDGDLTPLSGEVEIDETYVGARVLRKGRPYVKKDKKDVVLGMVERGGRLRLLPVPDAKRKALQPMIEKHISKDVDVIYTDEYPVYPFSLNEKFPGKHRTINHSRSYAIGRTHTNTIENCFSLFKRGLMGSFHHVSLKHLARYCDEFSYRFSRRGSQPQLFDMTMKGLVRGKALQFKTLIAKDEHERP